MSKQTAVEWLEEQLEQAILTHGRMTVKYLKINTKKAKQMEREQIEKAYAEALSAEYSEQDCLKNAKQYFTDTYGKEGSPDLSAEEELLP
jgi:predicted 2-oxoglutarate/Fe(II)-dependent dioxygenase YbiX